MLGYLVGLPAFLAYFASAILLIAVFMALYAQVTPHREFALIRDGNGAAVIAFLGATAGFALPLASAISNSLSLVDFVLWAIVAAVVQLGVFFVARLLMPRIADRIVAGEMPAGALVGGLSLVIGIVNAACLTY